MDKCVLANFGKCYAERITPIFESAWHYILIPSALSSDHVGGDRVVCPNV
jgi:hypothetical protein